MTRTIHNMALCLLLAAAAAMGGVALRDDAPVAAAPESGQVSGAVAPADKVASVRAVSRVTGKVYQPAALDKKTGAFVFRDLPGDARYDVCIALADGREYQGIDLDFADARLLRLAELRRKQLKLAPEPAHAFEADDAAWIARFVADQQTFTDANRAIYIQGHGRRATALVELMRTKDFVNSGGAVVWRVELWYFQFQNGGWEKVPAFQAYKAKMIEWLNATLK